MMFTVRWIGQAGYILKAGKQTLAIDPYCSDAIANKGFVRSYPSPVPPGGLHADLVVSTHHHGDHLDIETLTDYISFDRFYGPDSCISLMRDRGFPREKLYALNRGESVTDGPFSLTAAFADHTQDSIGVFLEADGYRLYFSGDTLMNERLYEAEKFAPDILFICINGKYGNMDWEEAADLAKKLKVKMAVPMHYDMFPINAEDPEKFTTAFSDSGIRSKILLRDKEYRIEELLF